MCENCSTAMDARQQVEFLSRYLAEQESLLAAADDSETRLEVEKTRTLLAKLESEITGQGGRS